MPNPPASSANPVSARPEQPIPYGCQTLGEAEIAAVIAVLRSKTLTQGPAIAEFEAAIAEYCQVPYAVAFANGTAALHAACSAAGLGPGDEAITTPITFVATANAVVYQQARPVFADIDPGTFNLDPEAVLARRTNNTKVILPVHFAGLPVDLDRFYALADQFGWVIIEDACHALGGQYHGKPIGQCRDMAAFSFHPVKSITTGEGGMVVTPHRAYYEKLLRFRTHGINKDQTTFTSFSGAPWEYEMQSLGYNYRMTDFQAAMGTVQLTKLDGFIAARNRLARRYEAAFSGFAPVQCQTQMANAQSAQHLFPIRINPEATSVTREALFNGLMAANIRPQVHYIPVTLQPYYQTHWGTGPGQYPEAEAYYQSCISLPLYPTLSDAEQDYVIDQVKTILELKP